MNTGLQQYGSNDTLHIYIFYMLPNKYTLYRNNKSIKMNISEIIASHESVEATEKRQLLGCEESSRPCKHHTPDRSQKAEKTEAPNGHIKRCKHKKYPVGQGN